MSAVKGYGRRAPVPKDGESMSRHGSTPFYNHRACAACASCGIEQEVASFDGSSPAVVYCKFWLLGWRASTRRSVDGSWQWLADPVTREASCGRVDAWYGAREAPRFKYALIVCPACVPSWIPPLKPVSPSDVGRLADEIERLRRQIESMS